MQNREGEKDGFLDQRASFNIVNNWSWDISNQLMKLVDQTPQRNPPVNKHAFHSINEIWLMFSHQQKNAFVIFNSTILFK